MEPKIGGRELVPRAINPEEGHAERIITPETASSDVLEACNTHRDALDDAVVSFLMSAIEYRVKNSGRLTRQLYLSIPSKIQDVVSKYSYSEIGAADSRVTTTACETLSVFIRKRYGLIEGAASYASAQVSKSMHPTPDNIRRLYSKLSSIEGFSVKNPEEIEQTITQIEANYRQAEIYDDISRLADELNNIKSQIQDHIEAGTMPVEYLEWAKYATQAFEDEVSEIASRSPIVDRMLLAAAGGFGGAAVGIASAIPFAKYLEANPEAVEQIGRPIIDNSALLFTGIPGIVGVIIALLLTSRSKQ